MKEFRIYVNDAGWERYSLKHDIYETKREVSKLVSKDKMIIVVEHDTEMNKDEVLSIKELIKK